MNESMAMTGIIAEAFAASGPQLVSVQVGASWGTIFFMFGVVGLFLGLIVLNYKRPQTFSKLMTVMADVYLTCRRAAMSMVVSIKTFKAQRKAEQAKVELPK